MLVLHNQGSSSIAKYDALVEAGKEAAKLADELKGAASRKVRDFSYALHEQASAAYQDYRRSYDRVRLDSWLSTRDADYFSRVDEALVATIAALGGLMGEW
ncbi:hypothetical protein [Cupriavidus nantongensis]|uniref:Uncharacterized protein n=1 Tax=Cupriavidus nantongensis TaxID=1796606 RepID=A0A142JGS0_9BURK|nr:hypothetical protein [Cupriavidus nantongensis]AMR77282.1 hypothetical protein A2G96_05795 [Cupriavidus nantongensis]